MRPTGFYRVLTSDGWTILHWGHPSFWTEEGWYEIAGELEVKDIIEVGDLVDPVPPGRSEKAAT
jgi:hypothetical protein